MEDYEYRQEIAEFVNGIIDKHLKALKEDIVGSLNFFISEKAIRRTNKEKRDTVISLLLSDEPKINCEIAELAGVSDSFVASVREEVESFG